jgi:hypothetical protein
VFEFGKHLFDGIEVRRVFREEEQLGAGRTDGLTNGSGLVAAEIVHDDDVAGLEGGDEDLFNIDPEPLAVDRAVDDPRRIDAIMAQCRQEGQGFPVAMRNLGREP